MKAKLEYEIIKKQNNYYLANEVLNSFKRRKSPDNEILRRLYGDIKWNSIKEIIENYFQENYIAAPIIREHDYDAPEEIYDARTLLENDSDYQRIHIALLCNRIPEVDSIKKFYGEYTDAVLKIFTKFIELQLRRKCDLTAASHLNRVGGVCVKLHFNIPGQYEYGALASIHDAIEDLIMKIKNKKGKIYSLENYDEFLDDYIPEELQNNVKILTNHYNLILDYIINELRDEDRSINKLNLLEKMNTLHRKNFNSIENYIENMNAIIEDFDEDENYIQELRWKFYKDLYLNGIANESLQNDNYRIFEIKGIDLSDNAHGKDALSLDGRIRNINKNVYWSKLGFNMKSTWVPLNNHIRENMEDAYESAELIVLRGLLEPQSSLDFVTSSLLKFSKMEEVFYK